MIVVTIIELVSRDRSCIEDILRFVEQLGGEQST